MVACPPLVLLLAVELFNGALKRRAITETGSEAASARRDLGERGLGDGPSHKTAEIVSLHSVSRPAAASTADGRAADGSTISVKPRTAGPPTVPSWIGWLARTTTVDGCCASGEPRGS